MKEIIVEKVNRIFDCNSMSNTRKQEVVYSRIAASNYLRFRYKFTFQKIADLYGKTHATIIYYLKQHESLYKYDKIYKEKYDQVTGYNYKQRWLCNWCEYPLTIKKYN